MITKETTIEDLVSDFPDSVTFLMTRCPDCIKQREHPIERGRHGGLPFFIIEIAPCLMFPGRGGVLDPSAKRSC